MNERQVWFLKLHHASRVGWGEVAPIARLSKENIEDIPSKLDELRNAISVFSNDPINELQQLIKETDFPSIVFGLEMALQDLLQGGNRELFETDFSNGKRGIPINGLVWMSDQDRMIQQIDEKLEAGFDCIKIKVGALNFEEEIKVLEYLRSKSEDVVLRLDVNGAFETSEVLIKLKTLAAFNVHSIEQPIAPGQGHAMKLIIDKSPIPIAFDEELIGCQSLQEKKNLLDDHNPHFLVLKPTLLGGFAQCKEWIDICRAKNIGWWMTSYLESNIGLSAIAQFVAEVDKERAIPHGLGTGGLYSNNLECPLEIINGELWHKSTASWDSPFT